MTAGAPSRAELESALSATWPAEATQACGPFRLRRNAGGGSRVSAATLEGASATVQEIEAAASEMRAIGQTPLFRVRDGEEALDAALEALGFEVRDPTLYMAAKVEALAERAPPVTSFRVWPPLAIQQEIWAAGGIGPDRQEIMARVKEPRTSLFGRINDKPAGTAFLGIHGRVAMLHALEIATEHRRCGLARTMMRDAAHWAAGRGAEWFAILVTRANSPANGLYTSLGFQVLGQYHYRRGGD